MRLWNDRLPTPVDHSSLEFCCHFIKLQSFKYEIILKLNITFSSETEYKIPWFLLLNIK